VTSLADPFGKAKLARIDIAGHMTWQGDHPIAPGAQKVDFAADDAYAVTPLLQPFADLAKVATDGYAPWKVGERQSIFGKAFPPFGLVKGAVFLEHDLVHLAHGMPRRRDPGAFSPGPSSPCGGVAVRHFRHLP
jgi:hypothetical protein